MAAADNFAAQWCFWERQAVNMCQLVLTVLSKNAESPEILCALSLPVTEATNIGLNCFLGLMVKCSCVEGLGCCSSTTT